MQALATPAKADPNYTPESVGVDPAQQPDAMALVSITITHNTVTFSAMLDMGGTRTEKRTWTRHKGGKKGWVCENTHSDFISAERRLGVELAEFVDGIEFPFAVANMLPGRRTAAATAAMEEAAKEVANG